MTDIAYSIIDDIFGWIEPTVCNSPTCIQVFAQLITTGCLME